MWILCFIGFSGRGLSLKLLTCDQASFFSWREGTHDTITCLMTIHLLLVQNQDFSLIGQETKGN